MTEQDVEIIVQRAREQFPQAQPRVTWDDGPPFVIKDFKEFIRLSGFRRGEAESQRVASCLDLSSVGQM